MLYQLADLMKLKLKPSNTAIKRIKPSPVARKLVTERILKNNHISTILDYGCGFGCDVSYYKKRGFTAEGLIRTGRQKCLQE